MGCDRSCPASSRQNFFGAIEYGMFSIHVSWCSQRSGRKPLYHKEPVLHSVFVKLDHLDSVFSKRTSNRPMRCHSTLHLEITRPLYPNTGLRICYNSIEYAFFDIGVMNCYDGHKYKNPFVWSRIRVTWSNRFTQRVERSINRPNIHGNGWVAFLYFVFVSGIGINCSSRSTLNIHLNPARFLYLSEPA